MARVLIIDDDEDILRTNRMTLEAKGHEVTAARSGQEGWDAIPEANPEVIVLDVMMEEFTAGFTLAQDIAVRYPRVPMVMLTSVRREMNEAWNFSSEKDGHWMPVKRFLEKPVKPEELLRAVDEAMKEAAERK